MLRNIGWSFPSDYDGCLTFTAQRNGGDYVTYFIMDVVVDGMNYTQVQSSINGQKTINTNFPSLYEALDGAEKHYDCFRRRMI